VKFTWDERKRKRTLVERSLDFANAAEVFAGPTFTFEDNRFDYGEKRFVTLGLLGGDVVVVVHTEMEKETRIIPMRRGTKNEQEVYFQNL